MSNKFGLLNCFDRIRLTSSKVSLRLIWPLVKNFLQGPNNLFEVFSFIHEIITRLISWSTELIWIYWVVNGSLTLIVPLLNFNKAWMLTGHLLHRVIMRCISSSILCEVWSCLFIHHEHRLIPVVRRWLLFNRDRVSLRVLIDVNCCSWFRKKLTGLFDSLRSVCKCAFKMLKFCCVFWGRRRLEYLHLSSSCSPL